MILPVTAQVNAENHLEIGGCDCVGLAEEFGTPLYIFDEVTLRNRCRGYQESFGCRYDNVLVLYAGKAFINPALLAIFAEEGLGLDVVSGGELYVARKSDFSLEKVYFHGNNKSAQELTMALDWGVGQVVVDNFHEMDLLNRLAVERGRTVDILLRLSPGVDPHTHAHITTGIVDSKFGFPIITGQAEEALGQALDLPGLHPVGLHVHIGSQISELEPYQEAVRIVLEFAAAMRAQYDFKMEEFSPGGGWAIRYTQADEPPSLEDVAEAIVETLCAEVARHHLPLPKLVIEPGRSIVGPAGVALYSVGARKEIPDLRTYIFVDGGIADNIRPVLYDARYDAVVANKASSLATETVTVAGKHCDSGDVLLKEIELPPVEAGDLLAIPACGAYCLSLASNYNLALRPAIVLVKDGKPRLIRRRESYEDLLRNDVWENDTL
ncbi:MAG: diaminopimelate decarboxylase [Chloroflexi bacterium]|nr:diaminopimelate decarboxylase [Chloroflexota bacterium]